MKSTVLVFVALIVSAPTMAQIHRAPGDAPSRLTIVQPSEPGVRLTVSGRVMSSVGRPVPRASIYVYQTDANGEYVPGTSGGSERPRLFGYLRSDDQGRYQFSTVKPGSYPNSRNPAHIHFEVVAPGHRDRIYEIVFDGDPFIPAEFRHQAEQPYGGVSIVATEQGGGGTLLVTHDIRLRVN